MNEEKVDVLLKIFNMFLGLGCLALKTLLVMKLVNWYLLELLTIESITYWNSLVIVVLSSVLAKNWLSNNKPYSVKSSWEQSEDRLVVLCAYGLMLLIGYYFS